MKSKCMSSECYWIDFWFVQNKNQKKTKQIWQFQTNHMKYWNIVVLIEFIRAILCFKPNISGTTVLQLVIKCGCRRWHQPVWLLQIVVAITTMFQKYHWCNRIYHIDNVVEVDRQKKWPRRMQSQRWRRFQQCNLIKLYGILPFICLLQSFY